MKKLSGKVKWYSYQSCPPVRTMGYQQNTIIMFGVPEKILIPRDQSIPVLRLYGYCRRTSGVPGTIRSPRSRSDPLYPRV